MQLLEFKDYLDLSESTRRRILEGSHEKELLSVGIRFLKQYPDMVETIQELSVMKSPSMDGMPHGSGVGDPTCARAAALENAKFGVWLIESTLKEVTTKDEAPWLLAYCTEEMRYPDLLEFGLTDKSRRTYVRMKRTFLIRLGAKLMGEEEYSDYVS